ncbi:MAG: Eco57I restriction-modification methylase domain-containing protein [Candidatus Odinarchaeota archaeon]
MNDKAMKRLGQFFTPVEVVSFMCSLIDKPLDARILEPCAGQGIFLEEISRSGFTNITAYEIDRDLSNESPVTIRYEDFLAASPADKYDVIIGNPPYVRWKNIPEAIQTTFREKNYWKEKMNGLSDLLYAFIYLAVDMLDKEGELIFITPLFWTETQHAAPLRKYLQENGNLEYFITFNEMRIFKDVSSTIMIFKYTKRKTNCPLKVVHLWSKQKINKEIMSKIPEILKRLDKEPYITEGFFEAYNHTQFTGSGHWRTIPSVVKPLLDVIEETCTRNAPIVPVTMKDGAKTRYPLSKLFERRDLEELDIPWKVSSKVTFAGKPYYILPSLEKLTASSSEDFTSHSRYTRLGDIAEIGNGMVSGLDKAFKTAITSDFSGKEKKQLIPVIKASNMARFFVEGVTDYIFVNDIDNETELKTSFPEIFKQLIQYRNKLEKRYNYGRDIPWWHWVFLRNKELMEKHEKKILVPCKERIDNKGYVRFALAQGRYYATQDVTVIIKKTPFKENVKYLLALLNSEIIFTWLMHKGLRRGGVLEFSERPLASIPIRLINWNDSAEVALHDEIVRVVDRILATRKIDPHEKELEKSVKKLYSTENS